MKPLNYLAIGVAGLVQFMCGAVWYTALGTQWLAGIGKTIEQLQQSPYPGPTPYLLALGCNLLVAFVIASVLAQSGQASMGRGVRVGALLWLCGFAVLLNGYAFEGRGPAILAINGGYQLLCFVIAGAITGGWQKKSA